MGLPVSTWLCEGHLLGSDISTRWHRVAPGPGKSGAAGQTPEEVADIIIEKIVQVGEPPVRLQTNPHLGDERHHKDARAGTKAIATRTEQGRF